MSKAQAKEVGDLCERLRKLGAVRVKVDDVEVVFGDAWVEPAREVSSAPGRVIRTPTKAAIRAESLEKARQHPDGLAALSPGEVASLTEDDIQDLRDLEYEP